VITDTSPNDYPDTQQRDMLLVEQVKLLYRGLGNAIVINALLALILVAVQYPVIGLTRVWLWLAVMGVVVTARSSLAIAWHRRGAAAKGTAKPWLLRFRIAVISTGVAWGIGSVLLFPAGEMTYQAFLALVLAGISVGSITILAVDHVSMVGFLIPTLAPLVVLFAREGGEMGLAMSGMTALFLLFIPLNASGAGATLHENFRLRIRAERQEALLRESEARLNRAQHGAHVGNWELDLSTNDLHWSDEIYRMFEIDPARFGASYEAFLNAIHPDDRERVNHAYTESLVTREPYDIVHRLRFPDGRIKYVQEHCETLFDDKGTPLRSLGTVQDITDQQSAENTLRENEAQIRRQKEYLQAIFETEPECVKVLSPEGSLLDMNPAGLRMLEVAALDEVKAKGLLPFIDPAYRDAFSGLGESVLKGGSGVLEFPVTGAKGTKRWLESHATPLRDENGSIIGVVAVTRDITEHKATEEAMRQMAFYDRLTNLPNRRLLDDRLQQAIVRARRDHQSLSLLFVDLDMFKEVNDGMGHEAGDWLLERVAERMRQCLREADTAARIGGDEFVVLLPDAHSVQDAVHVAEKIREALGQPFAWRETATIHISCSIGVAMYPRHADNARDLLRFGDEAMYRAKKGGRNAVHVFSAAEQPRADEGRSIVRLIWRPAYLCGEQDIDREHEELFRLANVLLDVTMGRDAQPEQFDKAFDALLSHVAAHFSHEEEILRARHYPGLDEHAKLHQQLLQRAADLRKQSNEPGFPIGKLMEFLVSEVVAGHMIAEDKKFFPLFGATASIY